MKSNFESPVSPEEVKKGFEETLRRIAAGEEPRTVPPPAEYGGPAIRRTRMTKNPPRAGSERFPSPGKNAMSAFDKWQREQEQKDN
jgi:hypothetical protein